MPHIAVWSFAAENIVDDGGGEGIGSKGGIAVFGQAPSGGGRDKSLWDVVRRSVKTEELWTKEALWREVRHLSDSVQCTYPNAATCSRSGVSVNDPKIGSVFVFLACVLP